MGSNEMMDPGLKWKKVRHDNRTDGGAKKRMKTWEIEKFELRLN
jgi:hypothetical protein